MLLSLRKLLLVTAFTDFLPASTGNVLRHQVPVARRDAFSHSNPSIAVSGLSKRDKVNLETRYDGSSSNLEGADKSPASNLTLVRRITADEIPDTTPQDYVTPPEYGSSLPDQDNKPARGNFLKKGTNAVNDMNNAISQHTVENTAYKNLHDGYTLNFDSSARLFTLAANLEPILNAFGIQGLDGQATWQHAQVAKKDPKSNAEYSMYLNKDQGAMIVANYHHENNDNNPGRLPASEIAYKTWLNYCDPLKAIPGPHFFGCKPLKYILHSTIANTNTMEVVDSAWKANQFDTNTVAEFRLSPNQAQDEAFRALMGTPNGRMQAFIVKDHHGPLGDIKVQKVLAVYHGTSHLIFDYNP